MHSKPGNQLPFHQSEAHYIEAEYYNEFTNDGGHAKASGVPLPSCNLSTEERKHLVELLKEFSDVFAWNYEEMPRLNLSLVCHTLNVEPGAKPVVQARRNYHKEDEVQIKQEIEKLLACGFIKSVKHPTWLANIVPVKKKNGQVRICIDYRDLNKACPKDEFPLPNMDMLID
ncbi:hypothetical protein ACLB2K_029333 [Fragaria x ananassa]